MNIEYSSTFESQRRLKPNIFDFDYCLLIGLVKNIKKFIKFYVTDSMTIIDYGCGAMPYKKLFPESTNYIGIDSCINPYADIVVENNELIPLNNNVADIIISTQVVYLINDYNIYLNECRRLIKDSGQLYITTHGTWTHHPASGGDYYRFTMQGLSYILSKAGFKILEIYPIVGTLGTGLHLRQLVFNSWLSKTFLGKYFIPILNIYYNFRIYISDLLSPYGTRMSSPVIYTCIAVPDNLN
jgi:hypothetical protein